MVAGAASVGMWASQISSSGARPAARDYSTRKPASMHILFFDHHIVRIELTWTGLFVYCLQVLQ